MPPTITQIVSFGSNQEAALADVTNTRPNGVISKALGVGIEEPHTRQMVLEWDSIESSTANPLIEDAAQEPAVQQVHVAFNRALAPVLGSPVTEIIFAVTKPEQDLITFGEIINVLLRSAEEQPGTIASSWGYTRENPNLAVIMVGWESVDAHKKFSRTEKYQIVSLPFGQGLAELKVSHFKF